MYKRNSGGWMKHVDFIILDILCLQVALTLAYACSGYGWDIYTPILYRNVAMFLGLADLMLLICRETMKGVIRRGHFREFTMTVKQAMAHIKEVGIHKRRGKKRPSDCSE